MKWNYVWMFSAVLILSVAFSTQGQVLNRLKQKVENKSEKKASDAIDNLFGGKKKGQNQNSNSSGQGNSGGMNGGQSGAGGMNGGGSNPSNRGGAGLISTPPDVNQNLSDADAAYKKSSYGEARYSVQQAMLGVELEIGNQILKSLPETVTGLNKDKEGDQVTSTGWGWAGLTIQRKYNDSKDKQFELTIANNSVLMAGINAYFTMGGYAQQNNGEQNWKQTKLKGYRAIIEFSEGSGYKLSVPIGQSSIIVFEGVNFSDEKDMMKSCEAIDIDGIKKQLGEQ